LGRKPRPELGCGAKERRKKERISSTLDVTVISYGIDIFSATEIIVTRGCIQKFPD
jgi:hypothetical protein